MRPNTLALAIIATLGLVSCTTGTPRASSPPTTPTPSVTPSPMAVTADPNFVGEAAQLVDEESRQPVEVRAQPADQAPTVATVPKEEVVRVIDSTRDAAKRMWYRVRRSSGREGWVGGQFMRFVANSDPTARPVVVMPGEVPILAKPNNNAPQVGRVRGGEILSVSRSANTPELDNRQSTWLQIDRGWVSAEFMFQPACLKFNGHRMMVVNVAGAAVRSAPNSQAQQVDRLEGGETVTPLRKETNQQGEWLQNEQGWVDSKQLFLPTCLGND
jgi:uncharacterized protein YgiM (DUF1202 family)